MTDRKDSKPSPDMGQIVQAASDALEQAPAAEVERLEAACRGYLALTEAEGGHVTEEGLAAATKALGDYLAQDVQRLIVSAKADQEEAA